MEDITDSEKYAFQEDVVKKKVREIIEERLKDEEYSDEKVPQWINDICESTLEELYSHHKPFKYVVTCNIMQRTGAALYSSKAAYWDSVCDGSVTVSWPKRSAKDPPNRTVVAIVTVFAVGFYTSSA